VNTYNDTQRLEIPFELKDTQIREYNLEEKVKFKAPFTIQFQQLWSRSLIMTQRSPSVTFSLIGIAIFNGLLLCGVFPKVATSNKLGDIQSTIGSMFAFLW